MPRATATARAVATISIAAITVLVSGLVWMAGIDAWAAAAAGFIPARFSGAHLVGGLPAWLTPLSATLLHGGLVHLGFNLVMLLFCGRQVEAAIGGRGTVALYIGGAYAAALGQFLATPMDQVPMIGASGAISALIGAYALLYGRQRHTVTNPQLNLVIHILWLAAAWIGVQLLMGLATSGAANGIAIFAHIGGFLAGLALARPLLRWHYRAA